MNRYIVGAMTLACACLLVSANDRLDAKDNVKPASMRFEWRVEGPADKCADQCRAWISAIGVISESTPRDFEEFANSHDVRGATLVLDSEGGSVLGAIALGRVIRRLDMTTSVGRTETLASDNGSDQRATLVPKASCESMCAFLLLGGTRRYVPPQARVLVHQIWLGSKSKRALESSYSAEELGLVQRDIGSLARYTIEMGGGVELIETALRVPPWEPMYALTGDDLRRMRVTTVDRLFEPNVPVANAPANSLAGVTTTARRQHSD